MQERATTPLASVPLRLNRAFLLFWAGQTVSYAGSAMAAIALPLLVLQTTGSVVQMGLVTAIFAGGSLLAGVVSGLLVDRFDRRGFMIVCDAASAVFYGAVPLYWWFFGAHIALLYLVAAPLGFFAIATSVATTALLPRLVEEGHLTQANSRFQIGYSIAYFAGPLLAGGLVGVLGAPAVLGLNALSYGVSVATLLAITLRPLAHEVALPSPSSGVWREMLAGIRYLALEPQLRWIVLLRLVTLSFMGGAFDLVVFRLQHELQQPSEVVGLVWGVSALGALAAGVLTPTLRRRLGVGGSFLGGLALLGGSIMLIGLVANVTAFLVLGISLAFGDIVAQIIATTLLQELTPHRLQGRAAAAVQLFLWAGTGLGATAETMLAASWRQTPPVFLLMGMGLLLLSLLGLLTPARRRTPE